MSSGWIDDDETMTFWKHVQQVRGDESIAGEELPDRLKDAAADNPQLFVKLVDEMINLYEEKTAKRRTAQALRERSCVHRETEHFSAASTHRFPRTSSLQSIQSDNKSHSQSVISFDHSVEEIEVFCTNEEFGEQVELGTANSLREMEENSQANTYVAFEQEMEAIEVHYTIEVDDNASQISNLSYATQVADTIRNLRKTIADNKTLASEMAKEIDEASLAHESAHWARRASEWQKERSSGSLRKIRFPSSRKFTDSSLTSSCKKDDVSLLSDNNNSQRPEIGHSASNSDKPKTRKGVFRRFFKPKRFGKSKATKDNFGFLDIRSPDETEISPKSLPQEPCDINVATDKDEPKQRNVIIEKSTDFVTKETEPIFIEIAPNNSSLQHMNGNNKIQNMAASEHKSLSIRDGAPERGPHEMAAPASCKENLEEPCVLEEKPADDLESTLNDNTQNDEDNLHETTVVRLYYRCEQTERNDNAELNFSDQGENSVDEGMTAPVKNRTNIYDDMHKRQAGPATCSWRNQAKSLVPLETFLVSSVEEETEPDTLEKEQQQRSPSRFHQRRNWKSQSPLSKNRFPRRSQSPRKLHGKSPRESRSSPSHGCSENRFNESPKKTKTTDSLASFSPKGDLTHVTNIEGTISDGDDNLFSVLGTFDNSMSARSKKKTPNSDAGGYIDPHRSAAERNSKKALLHYSPPSKNEVPKWFRREFIDRTEQNANHSESIDRFVSDVCSREDSLDGSYSSYTTDGSVDYEDAAASFLDAVNTMLGPLSQTVWKG